ncbi:MAG TPA: M36 family metallopeptidase [Rubricoccaceae bacterium]|nr:M36 family metallopeptidase [Rubricoccaceae bacterium]
MRQRLLLLLVAAALLPVAASAQDAAVREALAHLDRNKTRYGLAAEDLADVSVADAYTSRRSGTTHVYLQQRHAGIEIGDALYTMGVNRNGYVFHAAGRFVSGLATQRPATAPALSASAAATALAHHVGLAPTEAFRVVSTEGGVDRRTTLSEGGVAIEPVTARLLYHPDETGTLRLTWEVMLYTLDTQHYWRGRVDAATGAVLRLDDLVVHDNWGEAMFAEVDLAPRAMRHPLLVDAEAAGALGGGVPDGSSYMAYPIPVESPNHTTPAPPADARVVINEPADALASPYGWHDTNGAAGPEFTTTQGNNTHAYTDIDANNSPDAGSSPDGGAGLDFVGALVPLDLSQPPSAYRPAAVTNLFVWANLFHDLFYRYGFDEPSRNFQTNNYGRGGIGNDAIRMEAQDGSGTCNANYSHTSDGSPARVQMYVCGMASPARDGDLDNAVIAHEYGHGLSLRLVGTGAGCLSNAEQMGEGWSDLAGLLMTIEPGDTGANSRGMGTYLFGQPASGPGIRESPYSTNFAVNNYTYQRTRSMGGPHSIGFVWATIIWEVTWELIDDYGFDPNIFNETGTAGNQVMLQLLTEGMKLTPCSPGFVDARDAILAADVSLYGGEHLTTLWRGFARRGLGVGANQGSSGTNGDNTESFAEPEEIAPAPVTDLAATPDGSFVTLTWTAVGDDGTTGTADSYDIRYSTAGPITTDAQFDAATQVTGEPDPQEAGTPESFNVTGLAFNTTYHFAMKVADESFNISPLSNPASATTLAPPVAGVSPTSVEASARPGSTTTRTVTISNTGPSTLTYSVSFDETAAGAAPPHNSTPPTGVRSGVKGGEEQQGSEQQRGRGGPDGFGYSWIDSDEPGGPTYTWFDVSTIGTPGPSSDDSEVTVALPFTFEYYGTPYTSVKMSSNGYVLFGGGQATEYFNDPIPTSSPPNNLVAAFWDDLYPPASGSQTDHYYDAANSRYIFQWTNMALYADNSMRMTFQIILNSSGAMEFMYNTLNGDVTSATVGIENAAGNDGLQITYNAPYLHNNLAVRISDIWVSATPTAGTVAPGSSAPVELLFDAAGLAEGVYTANMLIATNDPVRPTITVPLTFTVDMATGNEEEEVTVVGTHALSAAYPNPFNPQASFSLAVARTQDVAVALYDAVGRRVAVLHEGRLEGSRTHRFTIDGARLASGTYLVRVVGETFADVQPVTLLK